MKHNVYSLKKTRGLVLSPLSGITSYPFRLLNRSFGCQLAFLEMINVKPLAYNNKKTLSMFRTGTSDSPLGIQILGSDEHFILKSLDTIRNFNFDILELNASCPKKKVTSKGSGAYLLKNPKKLKKLLKLIVKNTIIPVSVKIRLGWDNVESALTLAGYAEDAGVSSLCVHGRTMAEGYSGSVHYDVIRKIKKQSSIPVVASGNILSAPLAKKMFNETGCDNIVVARGCLGNPWIFSEIKSFLTTSKMPIPPTPCQKAFIMKKHLASYIHFYGETQGVIHFRKFFIWYSSGHKKIKYLRRSVDKTVSYEDMLRLIDLLKDTSQEKN